ncbi:hypothetical protein [Actinomadura rupiterrae]|uniref:hypothetical protein n=1 Tax=Actinomadura rupiterrae TaxID=559627 RepID=UPI0020A49DB9|nr:hypothetical protein [Actinomadura rupiterrae]MCP2341618.1 hypothetical protein [Actinomadura rupiterrae]
MGPHAHDPDEIPPADIPDPLARTASPAVVVPIVTELWETSWEAQDYPDAMGSLISALTSTDARIALARHAVVPVMDALDVAWAEVEQQWTARMTSFGYLSDSRDAVRKLARSEFLDVLLEVSRRMGPVPNESP